MKKLIPFLSVCFICVLSVCQGESYFVPSVSCEREGDGVRIQVSFKVSPKAYLYEHELEVKVPGATVTFKDGDSSIEYDGSRVYDKDFTRNYLAVPVGGDAVAVTVGFMGCLKTGMCMMPESKTFTVSLKGVGEPTLPVESGKVSAEAAESRAVGVSGTSRLSGLFEGFELKGDGAGYMPEEEFISWLERIERGESSSEVNVLERVFSEYGILLAMLLLLPLGLLLNLTPCVLPMIPINLAIIGAGGKDGRRGRGFMLGLSYGAGMALAYGVLGVAVVLTGSQFGALNSSGWFNASVAVVFVLLGLAMFEVIHIDLSRFRSGDAGGSDSGRGKVAGAFLLGGLSAVLAGACVAPVLIWALVLATDLYSSGNMAGLFLPFMLGVGMALPWPFLGAGVSSLPRPGMWMVRVRQLFGVVILALAVYYGYVSYRQFRGVGEQELAAGWTADLKAGLAEAKAAKRPVFIDFWGVSCKNCVMMDEQVFPAESVKSRMERYVKVKFLADDMSDPIVSEAIKTFGVKGFPTYVVLQPVVESQK